MEGPSLHLAAEQLQPFAGRTIESVTGNSKIGIERLAGQAVKEIFAWGKHLVFQFDTFALRVHFMLWGTFAATVRGSSVTGDYRRSGPPRLVLNFPNGEITIWAASIRFVEDARARATYDFTADIMADEWNARAAFAKVRAFPRAEIADVLLDQRIFAGVGNIIKNEVLFRTRVSPFAKVRVISDRKLRAIVADARTFSFRFLELRRIFSLRKNLEVYRRSVCPRCGDKIERRVHGQRARRSFFCKKCQGVRISGSSTTPSRRSGSGTSTRNAARRGGSRPATSSTAARASVNRRVSPASE
ncbi:MAG: endonuclease [Vicinamibacterales bacterium]